MNDWNFWIKALHSAAIDALVSAIEPGKPELGLTRRETSLSGLSADHEFQSVEISIDGRLGLVILSSSRSALAQLKLGNRELLDQILKNLIEQEARVRGVSQENLPRIGKPHDPSHTDLLTRELLQAIRFPFKISGYLVELWVAL